MRLGALFPQTDLTAAEARAFAEGVTELGFDHLLLYEHVLGADPEAHPEFPGPWSFTMDDPLHEPFVLFGYLAAVAPTLELVTCILIAPQRQTALVAKQAAQVDLLTGGKFRLGVGQGWNPVEYEALGVPFAERGARLEEQIELLRRLWQEPLVTFDGRYHSVTAAGLNPLPHQRPIPIWIGGSSEQALRRAARVADGFFPQNPLDGDWPGTLDRMRAWRQEAGLDAATLGIEPRINAATGTPDDWQRAAAEWRALGATHIAINTMRGGLVGADAHLERLEQAKSAVHG